MKTLIFFISGFCLVACGEDKPNIEVTDVVNEITETIKTPVYLDLSFTKVTESLLPRGCKYDGVLVDAHSWVDTNGKSYFVRSMSELNYSNKGDEETSGTKYVYAYHFRQNDKNEIEEFTKVEDKIDKCRFDLNMGHEINSIHLTDIDNDSIAEISFIYRLNCSNDVSSSTQKLILIEGEDRYMLNGTTKVLEEGGEFEIDSAFSTAPDGFLDHAKELWSGHLKEYDFEM